MPPPFRRGWYVLTSRFEVALMRRETAECRRLRRKEKRRERKLAARKEGARLEPWGTRDQLLNRLGFQSYRQYLRSDLWYGIRSRILSRDQHTCRCCSEPATQVHHRSYRWFVLIGEDEDKLISLCDQCHYVIEFYESGMKRCSSRVETKLRKLLGGRKITSADRNAKVAVDSDGE